MAAEADRSSERTVVHHRIRVTFAPIVGTLGFCG